MTPVYKFSAPGTFVTGRLQYKSMLAGNSVFVPADYESIVTASGTGSSNTINFNSIPQTYKHLQLRAFSMNTGTPDWVAMTINGDTTSTNYRSHNLTGTGSGTPSSQSIQGGSYTPSTLMIGGSTTIPYISIIDFLDYSNVNKNKTVRELSGWDLNGSGQVMFTSILWMNSNAINSLSFRIYSSNFNSNTRFALYGIKG